MDAQELSNAFADAVERAGPAIVTVFGRQRMPASGIVWRNDLVISADHVVQRDDNLAVFDADGNEHAAELVGRDPVNDVVVLRVPNGALTPAAFASTESRVGQLVLAVGRPGAHFGLRASMGMINAVASGSEMARRRGRLPAHFLRTDATPYPGFSGGPLVNLNGEVVGLFTTGVLGGEPIAIPAAALQTLADNLLQHGRVRRGFLGISSQPVPLPVNQRAGRSQETGLLIVRVEDDSPAAQGGLLVGDLLVGLDGHALTSPHQVEELLSGERVGATLPVEVVRGDQLQTLMVTIGERQ